MKKGYLLNQKPELIPANHDYVYSIIARGTHTEPSFKENWAKTNSLIRGVCFQPILTSTADVYDNASFLVNEINQVSGWKNGNPIIIDIFGAKEEESQLNLDQMNIFGLYLQENLTPMAKPLLRMILSIWDSMFNRSPVETTKLLRYYDILLTQPGAQRPNLLNVVGSPKWFEYDWNMYAYDETGKWEVSPVKPVETEEPIPPTTGSGINLPNDLTIIVENQKAIIEKLNQILESLARLEDNQVDMTEDLFDVKTLLAILQNRQYSIELLGGLIALPVKIV